MSEKTKAVAPTKEKVIKTKSISDLKKIQNLSKDLDTFESFFLKNHIMKFDAESADSEFKSKRMILLDKIIKCLS